MTIRTVDIATRNARTIIRERCYPFRLHVTSDAVSDRIYIQVKHKSNSVNCVDEWPFSVPDGFDQVVMPGLNEAINRAVTRANSLMHTGRTVL